MVRNLRLCCRKPNRERQHVLLERILKDVTRTPAQYEDKQIALSSVRALRNITMAPHYDELIKHADVALYKSKAQGRSRVSLNLITNPTTK